MGNWFCPEDAGKLLLRLALATILLFHGVYKIGHGVEWIKPRLAQVGLPGALAYGTYVAEVIAPVLLLLGVQARAAALVIAFEMVMAIGLVLRHQVFALSSTAGGGWAIELQVLLLAAAASVACLGAGRYAFGGGQEPHPAGRCTG
ncbi:MAG: DoxX family protein [Betaproteobacteria bacterium]